MKSKKKIIHSESFKQYISPALQDIPILSTLSQLSGMQAIIHDRIWDSVLNGELKPGAKVPELQIGEAFNVSRTIVRNVLIVMEQEDIITLPPNRGAYIAVHSPEKIEHAFETVKLITCHIARLLAQKPDGINQKDKQRLKKHLQFSLSETNVSNHRSQMRFGMEFLILLAAIHGNCILINLLERVSSIILVALPHIQFKLVGWPESGAEERIVNAILAGNSDIAESAVLDFFTPLEQSFDHRVQEQAKDVYSVISGLSEGLNLPTPPRQRALARKKA